MQRCVRIATLPYSLLCDVIMRNPRVGSHSAKQHLAATAFLFYLVGSLYISAAIAQEGTEANRPVVGTSSSPVRRLSDRQTASDLLKRSRAAMSQGNLELAEWYIQAAEKLSVNYDSVMFRFSDTPKKLRAELNQRKAASPVPHVAAVPAKDQTRRDQADSIAREQTAGRPAPRPDSPTPMSEAVRSISELAPAGTTEPIASDATAPGSAVERLDEPTSIVDPASRSRLAVRGSDQAIPSNTGQPVSPGTVRTSDLIERGATLRGNTSSVEPVANDPQVQQWQAAKQQSLSWLADARMALNQGNLELAERFARAAQNLRLPDEAYGKGEPRPWMLLMEVHQRTRRLEPTQQAISGGDPALFAPPPIAPVGQTELVQGYDSLESPVVQASAEVPLAPSTLVEAPPMPRLTASSGAGPGISRIGGPGSEGGSMVAPHPVQLAGNLQISEAGPKVARSTLPPAPMPDTGRPTAGSEQRPSVLTTTPAPGAARAGLENSSGPVVLGGVSAEGGSPAGIAGRRTEPLPGRAKAGPPTADPAANAVAPSEGLRLLEAGKQALREQDDKRAASLFRQAWKLKDQLDPESQQQLQDHLQRVKSTADPLAASGKSAGQGVVDEAVQAEMERVARGQAAARILKANDPTAAWEQLKKLKQSLSSSKIDAEARGQLVHRVDRDLRELEAYIEQNRGRLETEAKNKAILAEIDRERQQKVRNEQLLADLLEQFNGLMEQQRYSEAVVVAKKARELAPDNEAARMIVEKSQIARQVVTSMMRDERFREGATAALNDIVDAGIPLEGDIAYPDVRQWEEMSQGRRQQAARRQRKFSEVELQIQTALRKPVDIHFANVPLAAVMEQLAASAGINIYLDPEGLSSEGVTPSTPISLELKKPISLRSALNLILEPLHLSHVTQNEVLRITTEEDLRAKMEQESYKVADLVVTIPNFVPNNNVGLPGALREAHNLLGQGLLGGSVNQAPLTILANNQTAAPPVGNASVLAQMMNSNVPGIPSAPVVGPNRNSDGSPGGGSLVDFDTLINLITTTIAPDTWEDNGGTGTIAGFPTNLTLVVSNTQEVHDQIVDLLEQLRRLQDLQITIEVRFITLTDNFFERIGVDFDFNLDDNTSLSLLDLTRRDDQGPSVTVGLDPTGVITPDLDIQFRQGSFGSTQPAFGGFDANSAANIGFAILSDIEAFFLIQAAQGDTRTNVLQAPKVTLFDGQTASVSDVSQRPFVTSVIPVVGDFAAAHQPVITVLTEGTTLSVQAVVSEDRRFVRLTLVPFFSRIGDVDEFTFEGRTDSDNGVSVQDPTDDTQSVRDNERLIREGTTVQLPTLAFTSVSTTVSVPDGGTILLGGIKRLSEGRNEQGVPMLSKLPYINRLFRNVGIGRDTQSLMLMVTPRIIIHEEQEQKLGVELPP